VTKAVPTRNLAGMAKTSEPRPQGREFGPPLWRSSTDRRVPKRKSVVPPSLAVIFKSGSRELGVTAKGIAATLLAVALGVGALVAIVLAALKMAK